MVSHVVRILQQAWRLNVTLYRSTADVMYYFLETAFTEWCSSWILLEYVKIAYFIIKLKSFPIKHRMLVVTKKVCNMFSENYFTITNSVYQVILLYFLVSNRIMKFFLSLSYGVGCILLIERNVWLSLGFFLISFGLLLFLLDCSHCFHYLILSKCALVI